MPKKKKNAQVPEIKKHKDSKRPGRPKRAFERTVEDVAQALRDSGGYYTSAAQILGCSIGNVSRRVDKSPELQAVLEEIKEQSFEFVERKLFECIDRGEFNAICFYLKCKARDKGYGETRHKIIVNNNFDPEKLIGGAMTPKDASGLYVNMLESDE